MINVCVWMNQVATPSIQMLPVIFRGHCSPTLPSWLQGTIQQSTTASSEWVEMVNLQKLSTEVEPRIQP